MARPLLVEIYADARQYTRELDKAAGRTRKIGAAAKIAGGLLATGLAVGLEQSVKAAVHAEQSQARLEQAFRNAHISIGPLKDSIDALEASGRKLGFTDEQTKQALGSLIVSTGSYTASVKQLAIAQDLARFKSVDLETATKALTMAHAGSLRPLKQLGIDIPKVTTAYDSLSAKTRRSSDASAQLAVTNAKLADKQATFANVLQVVTNKVGGQSKAYSDTAAGSMARFHAETEHLKVAVGEHLLPALVQVVTALSRMVAGLEHVDTWMSKIGANKSGIDVFRLIGKAVPTEPLHQMASALSTIYNWLVKLTKSAWNIAVHVSLPHIPTGKGLKDYLKASGGPVSGMTPYIVGEKGPELFVPGTSGTIIPNGRFGRGGAMHAHVYIGGQEIVDVIFDPLRNKVTQHRKRGGKF